MPHYPRFLISVLCLLFIHRIESINTSLLSLLTESNTKTLLIDPIDLHVALTDRNLVIPVNSIARQRDIIFDYLIRTYEGKGIEFPVYDKQGYACYKIKRNEMLPRIKSELIRCREN